VEQNQCGCSGTGTIWLSFITGIAAGIAAALVINAKMDKPVVDDNDEAEMFI
jgi:hypothetical protein